MVNKKFYLTTPLYYINGVPHVGHTYTTVIADAIARYKRMCGLDVCFLTGTDEHGLNIERAARQQGVEPRQLADTNSAVFEKAWRRLGLSFDRFIRTTQAHHYQAVAGIFHRINARGLIYPGQYSGYYCVRCEAYAGDEQVPCPICGRATELVKEETYFFRLSAFQDQLLGFYDKNPDFVTPSSRMNEIVSFVRGGLKDLSISRTSFRWGVPFPGDEKHIFYVWFDALTGYLSGIGYASEPEMFQACWPADVQLIGKDIWRFHAVYWPAFLLAAGLEPPRQLLVHGWWTVDGEKMSKSRGNFITAEELIDLLRPDYIKYFLLRELPVGGDGDFSYQALVHRINSDLANDLGNLSSRTLKMIENFFEGSIPQPGAPEAGDEELRKLAEDVIERYRQDFERLQINKAIDDAWELVSAVNKYIVVHEPWALARDASQRGRLGSVLYNSAEALRISAVLLGPVIPDGTAAILKQLGISEPLDAQRIDALGWGQLAAGGAIGAWEAVYPRIDVGEFLARVGSYRGEQGEGSEAPESQRVQAPAPVSAAQESGNRITLEDFARVEMKVGKILAAERVPKSEKLVKLQVDIGNETRQVVAGIGKEYPPEALAGRLVVVVTNLQPTKLMGVESDGMIVAASEKGRPVLATFTEPVETGTRLK